MLFDLQGRGRRRVVQVVFGLLAVVFVVGFIGFGVGSNIGGDQGLSSIFGSDNNSSNSNDLVDKRITRLERQARDNPKKVSVRVDLTRAYFQRAAQQADQNGQYPAKAKQDLRKADRSYRTYVTLTNGKPSPELLGLALQIYVPGALNDTARAKEISQDIADAQPNAQSFLNLAQYAYADKDKRTGDLASQKVLDLTPKSQRKQVKQQIAQAKAQATAKQPQQTPAQ